LEVLRPTALPAVLLLLLWPAFMLLPARHARAFFVVSGLGLVTFVGGPWLAGGLLLAMLAGYGLVEAIAGQTRHRKTLYIAGLVLLHAVYWSCFHLPLPDIFQGEGIRAADRAGLFVLFSGIGLTFFRLLSYYHDRIRRGNERVSLRDYLAYMFFFSQLRHGPIERCGPFAAKLRQSRDNWQPRDLGSGLLRVGWAFVALLATVRCIEHFARHNNGGNLAPLDAFANPEQLSAGQLLLLVHLPGLLLYILESSFAHLQLGVSRVFGVTGTENYNYPLLATTPRKFWQRWNITLYAWLLDYAFKPLGGARRRCGLNITLTFVYCGLLHGLQLRCLLWGLWTGGTLALGVWVTRRLKLGRRRRSVTPNEGADRHMRQTDALNRHVLGMLGRLLTFEWLCIGLMILLDPDYCGLRILRRYTEFWLSTLFPLGG